MLQQGRSKYGRCHQWVYGHACRYIRMPGGCYVEGVSLNDAYFWKPSVGPIQDRPGHYNGPWHYWSTDGRCACMNMLRESPLTATKISPSSATMHAHTALHCFVLERKQKTTPFGVISTRSLVNILGCPESALCYILLYARTSLQHICSVSADADKTLHLT